MPKEKSTTELRDEKKQLATRSAEITNAAKGEKRMLNDKEQEELGSIQCRMQEINVEVDRLEEENRSKGKPHQEKKNERFSLRRAIMSAVNGTEQRDSEAAVIEEARKSQESAGIADTAKKGSFYIPLESRAAFTAATEAATGVVIETEKQEMLLPLEPNLVFTGAGVRVMTGLRGNIEWPSSSKANVFWEGENDSAKDGANTISAGAIFKPHRLTAYVDISEQLLIQENVSVENLVRQLLATAIAQKVEATAFGTAAHDDKIPDGMFQTLPAEITGSMSWAKVVQMETNAECNNALLGNTAYIMHPALLGAAKTRVKDASGAGGFVFGSDGPGMMNGYKVLRSTNVPSKLQAGADEYGIVFGDWSKFFLGQWGSINLLVDQYTQSLDGKIRIIINSYWDMGFIRKESFSFATMK